MHLILAIFYRMITTVINIIQTYLSIVFASIFSTIYALTNIQCPGSGVRADAAATDAATGASHKHKHAHKVQKESISIEIFIDKICDMMSYSTLNIFMYYQHEHNHNQTLFSQMFYLSLV